METSVYNVLKYAVEGLFAGYYDIMDIKCLHNFIILSITHLLLLSYVSASTLNTYLPTEM